MRRCTIILAWILVISFSLLVFDRTRELNHRLSYNDAIENPQQLSEKNELTPELALISAWHLQQKGNNQQALALYHSITQSANTNTPDSNYQKIHETALYNIGVINLGQAVKHWNKMGVWAYADVIAPLNQAKHVFKEILSNNPKHWDARYNLDYALRITPPPKQKDQEGIRESRSSVHSILPGQPAGGP